MTEKKGKNIKKILHVGHILLEFFKKVLKAMGKSSEHASETVGKGSHSGKGLTGKAAGQDATTKSSTGITSETMASGQIGAVASGVTAGKTGVVGSAVGTGAAGASVSGATIITVLLVLTVVTAGLGAYTFTVGYSPVNNLGKLIWEPQFSFIWNTMGVEFPVQNQESAVNQSQSSNSGFTGTDGSNTNGENEGYSGGDGGTIGSNIEFVVPENP